MPRGIYKGNKGKKLSDKTKELISKNHSRHFLGKKHSKETLEKISSGRKGKDLGHKKYGGAQFEKGHKKVGGFVKGDKHKLETIERIRMKKKGAKCPNPGSKSNLWKGGITPVMKMLRVSVRYKYWRVSVFERDNWTCIWCGTRSGNGKAVELQADHIKPFNVILKQYKITDVEGAMLCKELWDIKNGRTLCRECHKETKTWGRPKKGTAWISPEQMKELESSDKLKEINNQYGRG